MASTIVMPQMGYDMQEGRLVKWLKQEGDPVARGEDIAEIETDKAVVPMPASAEGVLRRVLAAEGDMVPVGQPIGIVGGGDEEITAELPPAAPPAEAASTPRPAEAVAPAPAAATPPAEVKASPVARRLAAELGVDLGVVTGSGPGGRITERDVRSYQPSPEPVAPSAPTAPTTPTADGETRIVELTRMRQAVARTTARSAQEAPHFYIVSEVDMGAAMALRRQMNESLEAQGGRVSVNDFIIKACALALQQHPNFNATFHGDRIEVHAAVNIGVAIDMGGEGLIQPAILNCEARSLPDIARASRDLAQRARENRLRTDEYTQSTFTVSNLGMFDVDSFTAIIAPPNCAILAVGSVQPHPVVRDGQITVAQMMKITLSVDHRSNDGAGGARFIGEIKRLLESPVSLVL